MPRYRQPTSSYPPEYLTFLRQAAVTIVTVNSESPAAAIALRAQLNRLRRTMRDEDHPLSQLVDSVEITMPKDINLSTIVGRPGIDRLGVAALRAAGCIPEEEDIIDTAEVTAAIEQADAQEPSEFNYTQWLEEAQEEEEEI